MANPILRISPLGFPWETSDPFLFCVHHEDFYPKGEANLGPDPELLKGRNIGSDFTIKDGFRMYHGSTVPGFPAHPHRGFETVTIAKKGLIDHADSLGAAGRFGGGDVQWMTAGKGVQHSEMFPLLDRENPNTLEIFQIWLNLPKKDKMVAPHFGMLWAEDIPKYVHTNNGGLTTIVDVIAGAIDGNKGPKNSPNSWASNPDNEVAIWTIKMEPGATWTLPTASEEAHRTLYFYKGGKLTLAETDLPLYNSAILNASIPTIIENGEEESHLLLLQGKPINEPVVQHGPFVMNTSDEINQAMSEFRMTQFGGWPWPTHDHAHDEHKGRFAKYVDGSIEEK